MQMIFRSEKLAQQSSSSSSEREKVLKSLAYGRRMNLNCKFHRNHLGETEEKFLSIFLDAVQSLAEEKW